jgi:outer membrane protein assembly factor BamA
VQPQVALAGDNSFTGFTSPVAGSRWRLEYSPTVGSFNFQTALADYRKYVFMQPFTLAFRAMHYGRYGKDSENGQLYPLYLGEETLIRGYGYGSIDPSTECTSSAPQGAGSCPVLDRMFGSRLAVANLEFRIPLFGTSEFGLLNMPYLPVELSPFFDAGVAYTSTEAPDWRLTRDAGSPINCQNNTSVQQFTFSSCADRVPVFSTGLSARINVLGYLILEAYFAHPFQRPQKSWVWGFQLAPGW